MVPDLTGLVTRTEDPYFDFGGCSRIYKGVLNRDSSEGQLVALKVIHGPKDYEKKKRHFDREITVWTTVKHRNITPFLGIWSGFEGSSLPCLVSPLYKNGNIMCYLENQPNVKKLPLITQITRALSYLHDKSIIHGDLKGSNVLINDAGEASLTDFGLSRILEVTGFTTRTLACTFRFTAPELFSCEDQDSEDIPPPLVTVATDVWAFAMTVIEIMSGRLPFPKLRDASVILHVDHGGRPRRNCYPEINDEVWHMIQACWVTEPNMRPTVATLLHFFESLE
jgi:serine/threonine protein kinase